MGNIRYMLIDPRFKDDEIYEVKFENKVFAPIDVKWEEESPFEMKVYNPDFYGIRVGKPKKRMTVLKVLNSLPGNHVLNRWDLIEIYEYE